MGPLRGGRWGDRGEVARLSCFLTDVAPARPQTKHALRGIANFSARSIAGDSALADQRSTEPRSNVHVTSMSMDVNGNVMTTCCHSAQPTCDRSQSTHRPWLRTRTNDPLRSACAICAAILLEYDEVIARTWAHHAPHTTRAARTLALARTLARAHASRGAPRHRSSCQPPPARGWGPLKLSL
jgi:hypothetical protein